MKELFIKNHYQQKWIEKISTLEELFKSNSRLIDEQSEFPNEHIQALRDIGYTKLTLPKEYGGEGFNIYDAILMQETLGSFDGSTALSIGWTLMCVGDLFENKYWEQSKLEEFAVAVSKGAITNRALSEYSTGAPIRGGRPQTTAKRNDNQWIINGRKNYTSCAPELDYFITTAWIEHEEKTGIFLIHKDLEGVSIDETWDSIAMSGTGSHDLVLNNVVVKESDLVEIPDYSKGFKLSTWSLLIPATYLGIAQAARDYAIQFANSHSPNSIKGTIAELPNVQTLIGEIEIEMASARSVLYGAAECYLSSKNQDSEVRNVEQQLIQNAMNVAKYVTVNSAINVVDKAMRVVGAKSLQRSNPLQRYYRDVRAGLHNPPMDNMTIQKLAETALTNERKDQSTIIKV